MYISPNSKPIGLGDQISSNTRYGRLVGVLREAKAHNALSIFEGRATIVRFFAVGIPGAHYWINLRKDEEGPYWDIQVHPDCEQYLRHFQSVEKGLGGARYKISLKKIEK